MGQFDDLPHLLVIADRSVAVFLHVRLDGCNPCLIVCQKLSKVPIGFPDVTRAATRYKVAEPVFPQCPLVDGNNVIHDQIVLGTAICAETTELINDLLPLQAAELFVSEAAQDISNQVVLGITDSITLVSPLYSVRTCVRFPSIRNYFGGRAVDCDATLRQIGAEHREALAGRRVEPFAGDTDRNTVDDILSSPIADPTRLRDLVHGPTERKIDVKCLF